MPRPKRGRPARNESRVKLWLRQSVYDTWKEKKELLGYGNNTNSEFAELILHRCAISTPQSQSASNNRKRRRPNEIDNVHTPAASRRPLFASTPMQGNPHVDRQTSNSDVDVTGISLSAVDDVEMSGTYPKPARSSFACHSVNEQFATLAGDPFKSSSLDASDTESSGNDSDGEDFSRLSIILNESSSSEDNEDDVDSDEDSHYEVIADTCSETDEDEIIILEDEIGLNETTLTASFQCDDVTSNSSPLPGNKDSTITPHVLVPSTEQQHFENNTPPAKQAGIALPPESYTIDPSDGLLGGSSVAAPDPGSIAEPLATRAEASDVTPDLAAKLQQAFDGLLGGESLGSFEEMAKKEKVLVSLDKLLGLFSGPCVEGGCGREKQVWHKSQGGVLIIGWNCGGGHGDIWESSDVLVQKEKGQKVYVNTVVLAASILLTGNNFTKVELFAKCLNLGFISNPTFHRIQKLYGIPAIQAFWSDMKKIMHDVMKDEKVLLSGDGRNDSPGFSAQYCVYSLMEATTKVIVDLEVKDKRETGGSSTVMEVAALKTLLERLIETLTIGELTTDASTSVMAMVRKLKKKYPALSALKHSLDVWHKSCKLTKALTEASKVKNCEDIGQWIEPIRNHFWHCCQSCDMDEEKLKSKWLGVAHHVIGEHEWADGQCSHGPLTASEDGKTYLAKGSKSAEAVRKIVFDEKWQKSLIYYVTFRHTGDLENFNSMMTKYAPKRNAFEYLVFVARVTLAAIDHNMHVFRPHATTRDGNYKYSRKYSKRTKKWHAEPVKAPKDYKYWPFLLSNILSRRQSDKGSVRRVVKRPLNHPKNLAPTLGMKQPTETAELIKFRLARYGLKETKSPDP